MQAGLDARHSDKIRKDTYARPGAFKTSMLQDEQAKRPIELEAVFTSANEIASRLDVITPNIDALFGLPRLFAQTRDLYSKSQVGI